MIDMNDFYEVRNSIYCYPNSNVLKNKLDIMDATKLQKVETQLVLIKLYELRQKGITGDFSPRHLIAIHLFIFGDLYPFAGKFRTENIAKDHFRFAEWEFIEEELNRLTRQLQAEDYLAGLSKEDLAKRLAYYLSELNVLHPFREGNGRTIREFIRQLALRNGYRFNLTKISAQDMLEASIESIIDDSKLAKLIFECLDEIQN